MADASSTENFLPPGRPVRRGESAWNAVADAASRGDAAVTGALLTEHPDLLHPRLWEQAVQGGSVAVCHLLLEQGLSAHQTDQAETTPLHLAVAACRSEIAALLLLHGADPSARDLLGRSPLDILFELGTGPENPEIAGFLLRHGAVVPLWTAARMGDLSRVLALLDADPTALDRPCSHTGMTPLQCATSCGRREVVEALLRRGASPGAVPGATSRGGNPALWHAVAGRTGTSREQIVDLLLAAGADPNAPGADDERPLHAAATANHAGIVRRLLEGGADPTAADARYLVPLDAALAAESLEAAGPLQEADDEVHRFLHACWEGRVGYVHDRVARWPILARARDASAGTPPVVCAALGGHAGVLRALLDAGAPLEQVETATGRTALHAAVEACDLDCATALLARGASPNRADAAAGLSPLSRLLLLRDPAPAQSSESSAPSGKMRALLEARGAAVDLFGAIGAEEADRIARLAAEDPDSRESRTGWETGGRTPLHVALARGAFPCAEALLEAGADVMAVARDGRSALCLAEEAEDQQFASLLRRYGANPDLSYALAVGDYRYARMLLTACPKRIQPEASHGALLHRTVERGDLCAAQILLEYGAHPDVPQMVRYGSLPVRMTPLHRAAWKGDPEMVRLLLFHGADVNATALCYLNPTPLMLAAAERHTEAAAALLSARPALHLRDTRRHLTALGWACSARAQDIVALLEDMEAPE